MPIFSTDAAVAGVRAELDGRDAANRDRANHEGTQLAETITDFDAVAAAAAPVQSVAGKAGSVTLTKADVGLANVDDTADSTKPVSGPQQIALNAKANLSAIATVGLTGAYSDLTGRPTLPFGFTYDQQAEPVGPSNGQTWRERASNGAIVSDWEWDASLAEWTDIRITYLYHNQDAGIAAGGLGDRYRNNTPTIFTPEIKRIVFFGWALSFITPTAMNPGGVGGAVDSATNYRGFLPTTLNSSNAGFTFPSFAVSTQSLTSAANASAILSASGKELRTLSEGLPETLFRGLGFISTTVNGGIVGTPPTFNACRASYKIKFVRG